jgi:RHS repeat-associated protein
MSSINTSLSTRIALSLLVGLTVSQVQAERSVSYTYTAQSQIATIDGPRTDVADITAYDYDAQGNRILIRNALGHETQISAHDAAGRPLTVIDPNSLTTQLSYDLRGRLISQSVSDGIDTRTTTYTYDPAGNLIQVTSADGSVLILDYDAANRLTGLEDAEGNRIDYSLDNMGNRLETQVKDATGTLRYRQQQVYNQLGRLTQLIDADSHTTAYAYAYDANGNLTQTTDANLHPTQQAYDALDRLQQSTDALSGTTHYSYDAQDNLTSVTDPTGLTTSYAYDGLGNLISQSSPDTGTTTYTYDEAGNRLTKADARGITASYSYDALNRLTQISYPDSSLDVSYSYDQGTNGIGRLTSMSDVNGTTAYSYNAFGQLTAKTRTSSDGIVTRFDYTYDDSGRLAGMTYPSGRSLSYGYDPQGRLDQLTLSYPDGSSQVVAQNIQRLPFGPIVSLDYGNGLTLSREYDQDYRLIGQSVPGVFHSGYQHDPVGNIIQWQDLLNTARDQQFGYDELDRLISASGDYGDLQYSYDAVGNRLSFTEGTQTTTYNYAPDSHQLLQILGTETDDRLYDEAGNTIQSLIGSYTYDDANRMVRYSIYDMAANYAYNGLGERVSKNAEGNITRFRYGENAQLLGEYEETGTPIREYIYLQGEPIAILTKNWSGVPGLYYLHSNHLGAVVKASDANQALAWDVERKPFGVREVRVEYFEMPLGYPGQYFDEESGNFYNYFRDYDPVTGRYLQSDPIGLYGGLNTYAYVGSNPLVWSDRYGLESSVNYLPNITYPHIPPWARNPWGFCVWGMTGTSSVSNGDSACMEDYNQCPYYNEKKKPKRPPGSWPADAGAREWDKRNGGGREGRDKFHDIKQNSPWPGGTEPWSVDPDTGDVYDPSGDPYDNLND